jgi:DNA polymerase-3 subunit alpha
MKANGYSAAAIKALWDVLVPFSDYAFNKAHTAAYGLCPTGPPTSRRTTRPSTWPPCSPASATTRTSRRSTSTSAGTWASRCCRPTSTPRSGTSPRSAATSASGSRRSATSGATSSSAIVAARAEKGRFTSFEDFLRKCPATVLNKRTIESLIKAGAFDSLGHPRRAGARPRGLRRCPRRGEAQEAIGQDSPLRRLRLRRRRGRRRDRLVALPPSPRSSGTSRPCSPSSARCSGSTSPTTRSSASSTSSRARRHLDRRAHG